MSNEKKKSEKKLYTELQQQVADMYNSADTETRQKLDAYKQTIDNYSTSDPMTNRDARRLYIDAYQRMLQIGKGEMGYNPTQLGSAITNSFGYYSSDEINNIGNQLAYKLFHAQPSSTQPTSSVSSTTTDGNDEYLHHTFVWNEGLNPDYFDSTTTKTYKVHSFIDKLSQNLSTAATKSNNKYAIHGLGTLTPEGISDALNTLSIAKTRNWETPDKDTLESFNKLKELAIKLNIPVDEFQQYFSLGVEQESETDPQVAARASKLKELKLTDATGINPNAAAYMKKMGWQALTDEDGITRLYNANYQPIRQQYSYIDDNPDNPNKFAFFVNSDGQYLYVPNLTIDYDKNLTTNPFAEQIQDEINRLLAEHKVPGKGIEFEYDPYSSYSHVIGDTSDDNIQLLVDYIRDNVVTDSEAQNTFGNNYKFVDVSRYFGGNSPVIALLPKNESLKYDMFGNPVLPETNYYYYDPSEKTVHPATKASLSTKFGYRYNGYGNEAARLTFSSFLPGDLHNNMKDANYTDFDLNQNMYGTTGAWSRVFMGRGKEASKDISENPGGWAKEIISFILNPNQEKIMGNKRETGKFVLEELGYFGNELNFIEGLYAFIQRNKLEDKVGRDSMRKLFNKYNELYNNQSQPQVVETAQQGTILSPSGQIMSEKNKLDIKSGTVLPGEESSKNSGKHGYAIASLALDVISLGTSFIPVAGPLISFITGLGSTTSQFIGDVKTDGADLRDFLRAGSNVALDTIGVIGGAGKVAKIAKNVALYAPILMGLFHGIQNGEQYVSLIDKIGKGKDLSVNEWMTLAQGMSLLVNVGRGGKELATFKKISGLRKTAKGGIQDDVKVKVPVSKNGKDTEIEVSLKEVEKAQKVKGKEATTEIKNENGEITQAAQEATTAREEALAILRQASGDTDIDFRISGSKVSLNPLTWSKKNRIEAATKNPLVEIDLGALPHSEKVTQSHLDDINQQIANYEKYRWTRKPKQHDGGKLNRLYQYINNK